MLKRLISTKSIFTRPTPDEVESRLLSWFTSSVGERVLAFEAESIRKRLRSCFGYFLVSIGPVEILGLGPSSPIRTHFHVHSDAKRLLSDEGVGDLKITTGISSVVNRQGSSQVVASSTGLPFESNSIDALVLHHSLDIEPNIHAALREANRVVITGGTLLIVGFNPWSMLGAKRMIGRFFTALNSPSACHFVSPFRLMDWLKLLNFEIEGFSTASKLPYCGSAYILVAKKRESCMTPIRPAWQIRRRQFSAVPVANKAPIASRNMDGSDSERH